MEIIFDSETKSDCILNASRTSKERDEPETKVEYIPNPHKALREKEAAEVLGVSVKTLQAWRFYCKGPKFYKLGRCVRYSMRDLEEFRDSCAVEPLV